MVEFLSNAVVLCMPAYRPQEFVAPLGLEPIPNYSPNGAKYHKRKEVFIKLNKLEEPGG